MVDAKYDVLAWNTLATHFIGNLSGFAEPDRNMIRWLARARPGAAGPGAPPGQPRPHAAGADQPDSGPVAPR